MILWGLNRNVWGVLVTALLKWRAGFVIGDVKYVQADHHHTARAMRLFGWAP